MAFNKFANANIIRPDITFAGWDEVRAKAVAMGSPFDRREARQVVMEKFRPDQFLLSHCTIIASVDTEEGGLPLGRQVVDGFQIDRKYADYLVSPNTTKYINNNHDCWERKLLLSSFRTFVGGENYVEHLQIPEMSKGKIIDAAARDIGDSVYVDILVATNLKHRPLISAVQSRQLQTLSMGCFIADTQVTMADGTRVPIQDIQPGDMVVTGKGRVREVLNHQRRLGSWSLRTIQAVGLPTAITATGTHPFYVLRPAKECACGCGEALVTKDKDPVRRLSKRFKRGHDKRIFNPNGTYSLEEARRLKQEVTETKKLRLERVRADELQEGDYLAFPRFADQGSEVSPGRARLLGYFLAEGSFLKRKGRRVEVQFNFSLEEKDTLVAEVAELLKSEFPEANEPWIQEREDRNTATVHVTGRGVASWFYQHGGEYSHRKRLSQDAMWWSSEAHTQLIEAWLRGDGHQRSSAALVGTTTSYDLACQMHGLMAHCGVFARMECVLDGQIVALDEAINGGVSVRGSNGKLAAFNLCVPSTYASTLGFDKSGARSQHLRVLDDHVVFPITKIEASRHEGWVFDIEVEEDHTYIADGAVVSNCQVGFTVCTKCGNVAEDETQLCPHIRYMKGNTFIDGLGRVRKIAELCGHVSAEPGSVKFIEASWVANPAFTGAVLRNILTPEEAQLYGERVQVAFSQPARVADPNAMMRAANAPVGSVIPRQFVTPTHGVGEDMPPAWETQVQANALFFGSPVNIRTPKTAFDLGDDSFEGESDSAKPEPKTKDPFEEAVHQMADLIKEKALGQVRQQIQKQDAPPANLDENRNNTLIKEALHSSPVWRSIAKVITAGTKNPALAKRLLIALMHFKSGGWSAVRSASLGLSGFEVLLLSKFIDRLTGVPRTAGEDRVYRTVMAVGGMAAYANEDTYLTACRRVVGRELNASERDALVTKGRIYDLGMS